MIPNEKKIREENWFNNHDEENPDLTYNDYEEEKRDVSSKNPFRRDEYEPDAWEIAKKEDERDGLCR